MYCAHSTLTLVLTVHTDGEIKYKKFIYLNLSRCLREKKKRRKVHIRRGRLLRHLLQAVERTEKL